MQYKANLHKLETKVQQLTTQIDELVKEQPRKEDFSTINEYYQDIRNHAKRLHELTTNSDRLTSRIDQLNELIGIFRANYLAACGYLCVPKAERDTTESDRILAALINSIGGVEDCFDQTLYEIVALAAERKWGE